MANNKTTNQVTIDPLWRQSQPFQPTSEMLNDLSVRLDAASRVTAFVQIENELLNNYAEMAAGHPATDESAAKDFFDHSESRETPRALKISPCFL